MLLQSLADWSPNESNYRQAFTYRNVEEIVHVVTNDRLGITVVVQELADIIRNRQMLPYKTGRCYPTKPVDVTLQNR